MRDEKCKIQKYNSAVLEGEIKGRFDVAASYMARGVRAGKIPITPSVHSMIQYGLEHKVITPDCVGPALKQYENKIHK